MDTFQLLFTLAFFLILYLRLSKSVVGWNKVIHQLEEYLVNKGNSEIQIYRLTPTEKIKYGVPQALFFEKFYKLNSMVLRLKDDRCAKVELKTSDGMMKTIYVEAFFKARKLESVKEFDSYEI